MSSWSKPRAPANEAGVTLVETLVALAISAIVTSIVVMAVFQYGQVVRVQHNTLVLSQQIQGASAILNRDLVGADPSEVIVSEVGDTLTIAIPKYTFASESDPTITTITYHLVEGTLVRTVGEQSVVVARHIQELSFEHLATTIAVQWTSQLRGRSREATMAVNLRQAS